MSALESKFAEGGTVAVTVTGIPSRPSGMVGSTVTVSVGVPGPAPVLPLPGADHVLVTSSFKPDVRIREPSPAPRTCQEPALQSCSWAY